MSKQSKSVAIVANTTWNIYNFRINVIKELLNQEYKVFVIAPVDKYIHYKKQVKGVVHIPLRRLSRDGVNPFQEIRLVWELHKIYKRIKPSLVLHYTVKPNLYGAFPAYWNNTPSLAVVTGLGYAFIHNGYLQYVTKMLYRMTSHLHKKVLFENIDDRLLFINEKLIKEDQGISMKGCGIDVNHYSPMPVKSRNNKIIFTFIGRLLYDKGVKEFAKAARMIKSKYNNIEFWLLGEIDDKNPTALDKNELMNWVKNEIVIYHGATDDVRPFIADSTCIVLPSYREAIARSITEGMAMEKPVITTDTPGCREAVDDGVNGFLVPIKDAKSLSNAMEKIINMQAKELIEMGRNGRAKVLKEFDDRVIARGIVEFINQYV